MKKFLLKSLGAIAMASFLFGSAASAQAEDKVYTLDFATSTNEKVQNYTSKWTAKDTESNEYAISNFNNNQNGWKFVKCGGKKSKAADPAKVSTGTIATSFAIPENVKEASITIDSVLNKCSAEITLKVSNTTDFSSPIASYKFGSTKGEQKVTITDPAADKYYQIVFVVTNNTTTNGALWLSKVTFTGEAGAVTPSTVEKPTFDLAKGEYCYNLTMACATEGAKIYYTIDGTEPTAESAEYTAPVEVWEPTSFKVIAIKGDDKSAVVDYKANCPFVIDGASGLDDRADGDKIWLTSPITVIKSIKKGSQLYTYFSNGWNGNLLVFKLGAADADVLESGTTYDGLEATYTIYNGLPELKDATFIGEGTKGDTIGPKEGYAFGEVYEMLDGMLNQYMKFENLTIKKDGSNYFMSDAAGENSVQLYNQLGGYAEMPTGDHYSVTGFVGIYKKNESTEAVLQFWPTEIIETAAPVLPVAKIDGVEIGDEISSEKAVDLVFEYDPDEIQVYYKLTSAEAPENPTLRAEAEDPYAGHTLHEEGEPIHLTQGVTGLSFYAQHAVHGMRSAIKTVKVGVETGVAGIEAEVNGEAVYFNLQGQRVAEPENGVYIRVLNGKAAKVVK